MLGDPISAASDVLRRRPAQSVLTMLGLVIGVSSFIAMVGFGQGARRAVLAQFEVLGVNIIKVSPVTAVQARSRPALPITDADLVALRRDAPSVAFVSPVVRRAADAAWGGQHHWTNLFGALPGFASTHRWVVSSGGLYDDQDVAERAKVCVIGRTVLRELFGERDPLGETLTLWGATPCRIIGVLGPKGRATNGDDLDDVVLLPLTVLSAAASGLSGYSYLEIEPVHPSRIEAAKGEITNILRRTHALGDAEADDFTVSSPLEVLRAADRTARILGNLLQGIAAISLLVGGIGVTNIQLVSVAERTQEIGIRAAIGASPRQIMRQFLLEALVLSSFGAAGGVVLGLTVASLVSRWMTWPGVVSPSGVAGVALFGISIGLIFGYLPARRAAQLDPVEALRHE